MALYDVDGYYIQEFDDYQDLAMRTKPKLNRVNQLNHAVFGMTSEAGEVAGILQKEYQGHILGTAETDHLCKELGDLLWFIAEACDVLGISMSEIATRNILKLQKRYPDGFEVSKSLNREEGDI